VARAPPRRRAIANSRAILTTLSHFDGPIGRLSFPFWRRRRPAARPDAADARQMRASPSSVTDSGNTLIPKHSIASQGCQFVNADPKCNAGP
jgi:hypothetical protein